MSAAGVEDPQGAEGAESRRFSGSFVHRSAVGDRHPQPDPGNRRQGRDHRTRRAANRVSDRKDEWFVARRKRVAAKPGPLSAWSCARNRAEPAKIATFGLSTLGPGSAPIAGSMGAVGRFML